MKILRGGPKAEVVAPATLREKRRATRVQITVRPSADWAFALPGRAIRDALGKLPAARRLLLVLAKVPLLDGTRSEIRFFPMIITACRSCFAPNATIPEREPL